MKFDEKGFSLVELLIAISLMAIGLLAAAGMQTTAINSNSFANRLSVATTLAHGVMEDILARESNDSFFDTGVINAIYDLDPNTAATSINIPGAGVFTATDTRTPNTPATNVTRVSVTVQTTGRSVTLTSYKRTE